MKNVEFSLKSFKMKKMLSLATCALLAMGVMVMPVGAATAKQTGDQTPPPSYTSDPEQPNFSATADASNTQDLIDKINSGAGYVGITVPVGVDSIPSSVFQSAIGKDINLVFNMKLADGTSVTFGFYNGIDKAVDLKMGLTVSSEGDILKNLKDEKALAFNFEHSGDLPGLMGVTTRNALYKDVKNEEAPLYLLNETTGKLEKQENTAYIYDETVYMEITHCSTYVVTDKEVAESKLQVAEPKSVIKDTGINAGSKTLALLAIGGAVIFFATRKEVKA